MPPHLLRRDLVLLALATAVLFLPGLGLRDLWNPDEARYAQVAREMGESGSLVLPRLNGEIYTQKPPFFFWSILGAGLLTEGVGEVAARLPSALAAIGTTLLVYLLGLRFFGRRAALAAAAALATCFKILWQGRFGQIDMLLTFWVTLAVWLWVDGWTRDRPGRSWLFFAATGFATVTKGPVGLLPPLLAILAFLAFTRDRVGLQGLRVGRGLLVWAAVVLAWLLPAALEGGREYFDQIVLKQNVTRYADPWHHFKPWYYYLTVLPGDFFPWSLFLPLAALTGRRRVGPAPRSVTDLPAKGTLFALAWVVVTLLFFSLSPAKRTVYILTCYPALALLVGAALDDAAAQWPRWRRWMTVPLGLLVAFLATFMAALPVLGPRRPELAVLGVGYLVVVMIAAGALVAGSAVAWWQARQGRAPGVMVSLVGGMAALQLLLAFFLLPPLDVFKSARGLSRELLARADGGEPYGIFRGLDAGFLFYTHRFATELADPESLHRFATRRERVYILAERDELAKVADPPPLIEVACDLDSAEGYLLLTNRPQE
jgi:4-amino-4-deoxy-L-arabinose transferase-like glycosyltransferase